MGEQHSILVIKSECLAENGEYDDNGSSGVSSEQMVLLISEETLGNHGICIWRMDKMISVATEADGSHICEIAARAASLRAVHSPPARLLLYVRAVSRIPFADPADHHPV